MARALTNEMKSSISWERLAVLDLVSKLSTMGCYDCKGVHFQLGVLGDCDKNRETREMERGDARAVN
ncbi:Hypothetical protein FKW44_017326, partial [Caligus rogercresseyi]